MSRMTVALAAAVLFGSVSSAALAQSVGGQGGYGPGAPTTTSPSTTVPATGTVQPVAPLGAAPGSSTVGEVIVTAQRREQSILKVPLAITAVSGAALTNSGVTNTAQLATVVPNLEVNSPYGSTQPNFTLRGIGVANEYNSNQASPIGVYVNDVYLASRTSQGMGLVDLDRVEVLRGPQGTLFGRNTTGGAINLISVEPSLQGTKGYVDAGYGNFDTYQLQAAGETTFLGDQAGLRLAANYDKGDGQYDNAYPGGKKPDSTDTLQGRASLRLRPDSVPLDVKIVAYGGRNEPTQAPVFGFLPFRQADFFSVDENNVGRNKTDAFGVSANIAYTLSPHMKLISITSYDGGRQNLGQAADGSPLDILDINWRSRFQQFSEEARVNYTSERLTVIAGLYYGTDATVTDNTFEIGSALGPGVNGGFFQHFRQERESYAGFVQGDYNITKKLVVTLGFRYTADRAQYLDGSAFLYAGNLGAPETPLATTVPCAGVPGACAYNPAARFNIDGSNNAPTGRAALSYTFDNGTLVYASYNRGYRSGAFNGGGYTSSSGINYVSPETVNAYEIGAKGRYLDNRLTASVSGFYYDYANQQVQDTRAGPVSFLVNAPKSRIFGADGDATYRAFDPLTLHLTLGLLNTDYQDLTLQSTSLEGNDLPFAPHVTLDAGFDWRLGHIAGGEVTLSPNVHYVSHQFFSPFNAIDAAGSAQMNSELQQSAYAMLNASLVWKRGNVMLRAWGNNLNDAKVLGYGLDLRGAGFPFNFLVPDPPRTYGIEARLSF